ncbi:MAG TPA: lycopene cyclase family protein [Anaerolineaceae bacterium]|nr:lycopene cyclase family protein [Anaerolineaceae bacterium]
MKEVEFLIAGGGGAGLALTSALLDSPLGDRSILIVDRDAKQQNDRTWCFWGGVETPFASLACHSWPKIAVRSEDFERVFDLEDNWRYWMVRGIDYYDWMRAKTDAKPNVVWTRGSVDGIREEGGRALVSIDGEPVSARWVFNSILHPGELKPDPRKHFFLMQHFKGWEIQTVQPVFDPACATFHDFRTPQEGDLRFLYILPFTPTRALVEYTIFSSRLLAPEEYEHGLTEYIHTQLGLERYEILSEENGSIPMTDYPFTRRGGERVLNIGTKGGLVKPSTGFAFQRMQADARAIVASLLRNGHPFHLPRPPARFRFYDSLLLQMLYRQGSRMKSIFVRLFDRNPIRRILRFLGENSTPFEDLALIATLPPGPFLQALWRIKLLRRI